HPWFETGSCTDCHVNTWRPCRTVLLATWRGVRSVAITARRLGPHIVFCYQPELEVVFALVSRDDRLQIRAIVIRVLGSEGKINFRPSFGLGSSRGLDDNPILTLRQGG